MSRVDQRRSGTPPIMGEVIAKAGKSEIVRVSIGADRNAVNRNVPANVSRLRRAKAKIPLRRQSTSVDSASRHVCAWPRGYARIVIGLRGAVLLHAAYNVPATLGTLAVMILHRA